MAEQDVLETGQAAKRALDDPDFALQILEGNENYPAVREAMLQDLAEAHSGGDVQGFYQYLQTGGIGLSQVFRQYVDGGSKPGGQHLAALTNFAACW